MTNTMQPRKGSLESVGLHMDIFICSLRALVNTEGWMGFCISAESELLSVQN